MRSMLLGLLVILSACDEEGERSARHVNGDPEDTGTESTIGAPIPSPVRSGRVSYQEGRCPVPDDDLGLVVPHDAIVQGWLCSGDVCVPHDRLTVIRDPGGDEVFIIACTGGSRFEVGWLSAQ